MNLSVDDERYIALDEAVITLNGVWDLPMIGNERCDIEQRYQDLTGGPVITVGCLDGAFVQGREGQICQLLETIDEGEFPVIPQVDCSKIQFKEFLDAVVSMPKVQYFPAERLPTDSVIVVRTSALREFEGKLNDDHLPAPHQHLSDKLVKMNLASTKFWSNADRDDRGTHPDNRKVAAWLVQQGFSPTLADKAATIIRPEWAPTGRKPEE